MKHGEVTQTHLGGMVQVAPEEKGETRHTPHHGQNDAASFESHVSTSLQLTTLLYHVLFMTVAIIQPDCLLLETRVHSIISLLCTV